jgi:hypothetical protein
LKVADGLLTGREDRQRQHGRDGKSWTRAKV